MTHSKPIPSADPLPQSPHRSDGSSERTGEACQQPLVNDIAVSSGAIAGVKLPITCNDIRGIAYMDQQVVACFCQGCSQRVAAGHDRPLFRCVRLHGVFPFKSTVMASLFPQQHVSLGHPHSIYSASVCSFTRFERHSGSKAKKWRLSLRIDPGSIPECAAHEPPLPLGQWLDMRGLPNWAPRATMKVGRDSDEDGSGRFHRTSSGPGIWGPMAGVKRDRTEYETPDPPSLADQQAWLDEQIATFEAAAEEKDGQSAAAAQAGKHSAIFRLVYGLLAAGEERRAFNEDYLPWLNDLQQSRLETEFCTLHGYLRLVKEVGVDAAVGQSKAYLRSMLRRIAGSG